VIIRPDHKLLAIACSIGAASLAHSGEILDGTGKKDVVPAADV
jgi:hypothetical protein